MKKEKAWLGFDVGGTKLAVSVGWVDNGHPVVLQKDSFPTPPDQMDALNQMCAIAEKFSSKYEFISAGISAGNPMNAPKGEFLNPPNLPGWHGISWTKTISERFGIPSSMENDANACALAEWFWGAGKGCENMVFLTFGTGFGAGLILNGRLYSGICGNAGELGHWRLDNCGPSGYGKIASFESFCSGGGIRQIAQTVCLRERQKGNPTTFDTPEVSAKSVAAAAFSGDPFAKEIFEISGYYLGKGLAFLIDLLNPERIVIGSIFARSEALLRPAMEKVLKEECLTDSLAACQIVPAALGDSVGDYAALAIAMQEGIKNDTNKL